MQIRNWSTALAFALCLGLAACGGDDEKPAQTGGGTGGGAETPPAAAGLSLGGVGWTGGEVDLAASGVTAISFFKPG